MPATKKAATKDHLRALAARAEECIAEVASAAAEAIEEAEQNLSEEMAGATAAEAGTKGMVPAPAAGEHGAFLKGDGTWGYPVLTEIVVSATTPSNTNVIWFKTTS